MTDKLKAQHASDAVISTVSEALETEVNLPRPISRCLVASERGVLLDELTRTRRNTPVISWDGLPDVAHWLSDAAGAATFVLALVDHEGGDVTTYSSATMRRLTSADPGEPSPWEHKVRGGAWSHYNLQRSSETVWARNADEVIAEINRQTTDEVELVIIGGEADMRSKVLRGEQDWRADVEVLDNVSRATNSDREGLDRVLHEVDVTLRARDVARRLSAVHLLRDRMGQGRGAATGTADVTNALVQGQVERLLLDPEATAEQQIDPSDHPGLSLGSVPVQGPYRADRLLIALAALTDAEIVITRAATMAGAPTAAVLRW